VTILGTPQSASSRLNLTQAFNSLGTTIAPLLGGYLIFDHQRADSTSADSVKLPYLFLSGILLLIGIIIKLIKLPTVTMVGTQVKSTTILKQRNLLLGVIGIFAYVGGEVTVGSNFISFIKLPKIGGFTASIAKNYLTFFWAGAMIGRFIGAVALSIMPVGKKYNTFIGIGLTVFLLIWTTYDFRTGLGMFALVCFNAALFRLAKFIPENTLSIFAGMIILLLVLVIFLNGMPAVWCIVAIGFFNSIMFPTIFTLAVKGLGDYTSQGSSLLVMACVGGAAVPLVQGYFTDITNNLQLSFFIPVICYAYILFFGLKTKNQGSFHN
jgi:FHS family L-fucose permease-like MFS transporter